MNPVRTILVDDEAIALKHLFNFITRHCPGLQIVAKAGSVDTAIDTIHKNDPELVFLDIELSGESSFEILDQAGKRNYEVIFVTAHDEFGIQAVKHNALDYVLKPINKKEMLAAVDKALELIKGKRNLPTLEKTAKNEAMPTVGKLSLPTQNGLVFIEAERVLYCESDGRYTWFYLSGNDKKLLVSKSIGDYEQLLGKYGFVRIHHQTLVNLRFVEKYVNGRGGYIVLNNGATLQVSSRKREEFLNRLN